jgi:hypothetical protein
MRRLQFLAAIAALAVAAPALAQQTKPANPKNAAPATSSAPAKPSAAWASGKIERVDAQANTIVIKQGTHEMTFTLASDAKLVQGKKTLQASDLGTDVGKNVKIQYTMSGSTRTASRVEVAEAAAKGKAPTGR